MTEGKKFDKENATSSAATTAEESERSVKASTKSARVPTESAAMVAAAR
jgi:hypothetical protein